MQSTDARVKLMVRHDGGGRIIGAVAYPTGAPRPLSAVGPGEHLTEVDAPERLTAQSPHELARAMQELIAEYRISDGRLVRSGRAG